MLLQYLIYCTLLHWDLLYVYLYVIQQCHIMQVFYQCDIFVLVPLDGSQQSRQGRGILLQQMHPAVDNQH